MKYVSWASALFVVLVLSQMSLAQDSTQKMSLEQDACYSTQKKTATWGASSIGTQVLIPGVHLKQIFVCSVVASGLRTASSGASGSAPTEPVIVNFDVTFEAGEPDCFGIFQGFGELDYLPSTTVSVGSGGSTQFTVPTGQTLCIVTSGPPPFFNTGWVTYVQK